MLPSNRIVPTFVSSCMALTLALVAACSSTGTGPGGDGAGAGGILGGPGSGDGGPGDGVGGNGAGTGTGGVGGLTPQPGCENGYRELSDGFDGVNVERVCIPETSTFDRAASLAAFETTLYPLLRDNCAKCHSSQTEGQAPIHADGNVELAHEYALTRVNFRKPQDSKFVVRMGIDRHNCFGGGCSAANTQMLAAVNAWVDAIAANIPPTPRSVPEGQNVPESDVLAWIATDKATVAAADLPYTRYASLHEIHNDGVTADELNLARVALSKALNTAARWAPEIKNPVDINGQGMVYRFDTRWYWGFNKGITKLNFGGSDDDAAFGRTSVNYLGESISASVFNEQLPFTAAVTEDPSFAQLVWGRIEAGNVEGATDSAVLPPNVNGFESEYIEAGQLVYTLTRPDVYNAIMAIPWFADALEKELGVINDQGAASYTWILTQQAITVDSRLYYRADTTSPGAYYWKTWDVFTGQLPNNIQTIEAAWEQGQIRFPFWANPIPKFVHWFQNGPDPSYSFIATLAQHNTSGSAEPAGCDGQPNFGGSQYVNCRFFTGTGGLQQSAEEVIWGLPNGLQGYALFGGFNQRRVDAFVNIVRDPRILETDSDAQINSLVGFASADRRLNTGSSCIGCHADGMNRGNNDLRDWLDFSPNKLPTGAHGVDSWVNDATKVEEVKVLYPPSSETRPLMEQDRRRFLAAQYQIATAMMLGDDKNFYVEPAIWTIEWAREHYAYPTTRSN